MRSDGSRAARLLLPEGTAPPAENAKKHYPVAKWGATMIRSIAFLALFACRPGAFDSDSDVDSDSATDPVDTSETDLPQLHPARVALPYAELGEAAPSSALDGAVAHTVDGPFTLDGGDVAFAGSMAEPGLYVGLVTWGDGSAPTELAAVVGDAGLGSATWSEGDYDTTVALVDLPSAPNADGSTPWSDDTVMFAVSGSFGDDGVNVITHLHGHNSTIEGTAADQLLVEQYALSGRDAVFIAPQGPVQAASGDFGQLMDPGGHERLVRDAISVLYRDGFVTWPVIGDQVLTSHSGGYYATAAIVRDGGLAIDAVHLFDSLYGERATFRDYAADGGVLRSNYTASGGTSGQNGTLVDELVGLGVDVTEVDDDEELLAGRATIAFADTDHGLCMRDRLTDARWLAWSGLPFGAGAVPELRSVVASGSEVRVSFVPDGDPESMIRVEGSNDGAVWEALATVDAASAVVPVRARYRVRLVRGDVVSAPSDVYGFAAGGARWLVVDGFDRVFGGSWSEPAHSFAAEVAIDSGLAVDAAADEAVSRGDVELGGYDGVIWLLGDESTSDVTLDAAARSAIAAYVGGGGRLVLSGSEVGYASNRSWLSSTLGATYVSDDAGTTTLQNGWSFGVAYTEDWPDVLSGTSVVWRYDTGGAAAVVDGSVAVVGFPLETLDPAIRATALTAIVDATAP